MANGVDGQNRQKKSQTMRMRSPDWTKTLAANDGHYPGGYNIGVSKHKVTSSNHEERVHSKYEMHRTYTYSSTSTTTIIYTVQDEQIIKNVISGSCSRWFSEVQLYCLDYFVKCNNSCNGSFFKSINSTNVFRISCKAIFNILDKMYNVFLSLK